MQERVPAESRLCWRWRPVAAGSAGWQPDGSVRTGVHAVSCPLRRGGGWSAVTAEIGQVALLAGAATFLDLWSTDETVDDDAGVGEADGKVRNARRAGASWCPVVTIYRFAPPAATHICVFLADHTRWQGWEQSAHEMDATRVDGVLALPGREKRRLSQHQ